MLYTLLSLPLLGSPALHPPPARPPVRLEDAEERYEALTDEMDAIVAAWRKQVTEARQAPQDGESVPAIPMSPDFSSLIPKFQQAAADFAGTDDAVQFLTWLLTSRNTEAATAAIATLTESHAGSSAISEMGGMFGYLAMMTNEEAAAAFLAAVKAENKDQDVLGWVALTEHKDTIDKAPRDSDEYRVAKETLLAHAEKVKDARLKSQITGAIELREKYGVGCVAPDIVGTDLGGVDFKLSDYEGKIIFLDFWGDW